MSVGQLYKPKLCVGDIQMIELKPERIHVSGRNFDTIKQEWIIVEISDDEYRMCQKAGEESWAAEKEGSEFKEGCGNTEGDPYKVERTGYLGQMAFGKAFSQPVDLVYRKYGDEYDNIIENKTLDIKCAMRNYGMILIRHSENGWKADIDKDIYVGSFVSKENRELETATVVLAGYVTKEHILEKFNNPHRAKKKGASHLNYEIPFNRMESIFDLLQHSIQKSGMFQT